MNKTIGQEECKLIFDKAFYEHEDEKQESISKPSRRKSHRRHSSRSPKSISSKTSEISHYHENSIETIINSIPVEEDP